MKKVMCIICLMLVSGCWSRITLENIQQHIDDYYQSTHPTWSEKKAAVEGGRTTTLMTLTEIRLATSVRKVRSGHFAADLLVDDNGCWYGNTSQKAGGLLWWTVTQYKSYGGSIRTIKIPEYTYYFKWNSALNEYVCYDWVQW